jgi:hypothetical protein
MRQISHLGGVASISARTQKRNEATNSQDGDYAKDLIALHFPPDWVSPGANGEEVLIFIHGGFVKNIHFKEHGGLATPMNTSNLEINLPAAPGTLLL